MPELTVSLLAGIGALAFVTGVLHGATGMAGGVVMAAILAHWVGIKTAIPVMTCALIFSHTTRVLMFRRDTQWHTVARVLAFGLPTTVIGVLIFVRLNPATVALIMALVLLASFPLKYWARRQNLRTGPTLLSVASAGWGMLSGNVIGPGFFLAPFLLGTGMGRLAFVGTLASVTLAMNMVKLTVFGAASVMTEPQFALGVMIGLITIPGNWTGRHILKRIGDSQHRTVVDILTALVICNFFYLFLTTR